MLKKINKKYKIYKNIKYIIKNIKNSFYAITYFFLFYSQKDFIVQKRIFTLYIFKINGIVKIRFQSFYRSTKLLDFNNS